MERSVVQLDGVECKCYWPRRVLPAGASVILRGQTSSNKGDAEGFVVVPGVVVLIPVLKRRTSMVLDHRAAPFDF